MGRKPNPLILEHFERGAKLQDSSNRYEHTCKHCGEKFPKGRIDGLQLHLVRKCPALSLSDRQEALMQLNNLPSLNGINGHNGMVPMNGPSVALPIGTGNWTPLETLAEVSRQVNLREHHDDRPANNRSADTGNRASEPPHGDRLELQESYTWENPPKAYEQRATKEKRNANQQVKRRESQPSLPRSSFHHTPHSRATTPNLAMAATSIAAAAAAARFQPSMVDPQLLGDDTNRQGNLSTKSIEQQLREANAFMSENFPNAGQAEQELTWPMIDGSGTNTGMQANMNPGMNAGMNAGMNNSITNGVTAEMNPGINTYAEESVEPTSMEGVELEAPKAREFARIAMNPSMATAMTTEFTTEFGDGTKPRKPKVRGKFNAERRKEVQNVRRLGACIRCRMLKKPCSEDTPCSTCKSVDQARVWKVPCIRTRLAEDLEVYSAGLHSVLAYRDVSRAKSQAVFHSSPYQLEFSQLPNSKLFATFNALVGQEVSVEGNIDPGLSGDFTTKTYRLLDSENADLAGKVYSYMKKTASIVFDQEVSNFMRTTLRTAQDLVHLKNDDLLERALDLWTIVHMLIDGEKWIISERVDIDAPPGHGPAIDQVHNKDNYDILVSQLNAATEKKANSICKQLLLDLERRLLKKQDSNTFETFLVAILLLNCIEKSTWLFKYWEQAPLNTGWPLEKSASHFSQQGDRLTSMLAMILNLRGVLPKMYTREDGMLATKAEGPIQDYFETLQLRYNDVLNAQVNHTFNYLNSRCYELRFCSDLILQNRVSN